MCPKEICELRVKNALIKVEDNDSDITYIFINGYKNDAKEQLRFEWEKSTADLPVNRIFVIGTVIRWYHDCLDEIIPVLKERTQGKKVLVIGSSMGGYGALIAAHILRCSSLTFGPQTIITRDFLKMDPRWESALRKVNDMTAHPEWLDISYIEGDQHHIYYSSLVPLDVVHATRMKCKLFPEPHNSHNVAGKLKEDGRLKAILAARMNDL